MLAYLMPYSEKDALRLRDAVSVADSIGKASMSWTEQTNEVVSALAQMTMSIALAHDSSLMGTEARSGYHPTERR